MVLVKWNSSRYILYISFPRGRECLDINDLSTEYSSYDPSYDYELDEANYMVLGW